MEPTLQPENITYIFFYFQNSYKYFSGIHCPKITFHMFICDSENYMEKLFGNYLLGKSHLSYTKNVLGIIFAIISG